MRVLRLLDVHRGADCIVAACAFDDLRCHVAVRTRPSHRRRPARFVDAAVAAPPPARVPEGEVELLAFCGGGKDSLVAMNLLERAGPPFATLAYSHSIYGAADHQR